MSREEAKTEFEKIFEVPDFLFFDGEDYMYYEDDPLLTEERDEISAKWRGFFEAWGILKKDLNTATDIVNRQIKEISKLKEQINA